MKPYSCIKCGKTNTFHEINKVVEGGNESRGYSFGKGLLGTALLGPVGAVAGINGKKKKGRTFTTTYCQYTSRLGSCRAKVLQYE